MLLRVSRVHPLERAAATAAAAVQRGKFAVEGFDDAADALLIGVLDGGLPAVPAERPAWRKASILSSPDAAGSPALCVHVPAVVPAMKGSAVAP